jgi:signal transduction histidine kinase
LSAVLPLKESSREMIVEVLRALEPYFPDVTERWRDRLMQELGFGRREIVALERLTLPVACTYCCHGDFAGFFENLHYYGTRLAKLQTDTRAVAQAMEAYQELCEPYLHGLFGERQAEANATLDVLRSASFVAITGAYVDTKNRESSTLLSVMDAELAAGDLEGMLQLVLDITVANFGANIGVLLLRRHDSEGFQLSASTGLEDVLPAERGAIAAGDGFCGSIATSGEPEMLLDTKRDTRILSPKLKERATSLWGVPLRSSGKVIGVLIIGFERPYEWLPNERDLLRAIADRSTVAIERAQMTEALRERESRIAELSAHLLKAQEEERKRISRELHDETGQALMVIRLYLGMLESALTGRTAKGKVRETVSVVDRTIEGLRRIISKLSPLVLQELGMIAAIRKEAKDLAKNTGVKVRVIIGDEVGRLSPEIEMAIYRVVQEALHNVAKHAQARTVTVHMAREGGMVRLEIEDDGIGMPTKINSRGHSFGLAGIKERIASLGGDVDVRSTRGKGTRLEVTVPAGEHVAAMSQTA